MRRGYSAAMRRIVRHPWVAVTMAVVGTLAAALTLPFLGGEFLPEFREGHFVLQVSQAPGGSLAELLRVGEFLAREDQANVLLLVPDRQTIRE